LRDELHFGDTDADEYTLTDEAQRSLDRAAQLWQLPSSVPVSEDDWLELLASLHYLRHIAYRPGAPTADFDSVFQSLAKSKPQFAGMKREARAAWNRLERFGLTRSKKAR